MHPALTHTLRGVSFRRRSPPIGGQYSTPINILDALRRWQEHCPGDAWVFSLSGKHPLDDSKMRKVFNQVLDKAGLPRRGPHQMRHTFATLLLEDGAPITYVTQQIGHKDASITLRVYAHWIPRPTGSRGVDRLDIAV